MPEELKGKPADYGMACSPLVVGEQVIVHVGAPQAAVAAYDIDTRQAGLDGGRRPGRAIRRRPC